MQTDNIVFNHHVVLKARSKKVVIIEKFRKNYVKTPYVHDK